MKLPGVRRLAEYQRAWLRLDVVGGLTVGAMLVPQSMAYAELGGMPPEAGFYAVLLPLIVYALLGSSRHLGIGPEPGTAILSATAVGAVAQGDPARYATLMAALAVMVAVICLVGFVLRLGFMGDLLSRPVLVGYITGVGLTLIGSQLSKVTGVALQADGLLGRAVELVGRLGEIHGLTLMIGLGAFVLIVALKRWPALPGALLAVMLATGLAALFSWQEQGLAVVGHVPEGLPPFALPLIRGADVVALLPGAVGVALVAYSDLVLTARAVAVGRGYRIDANQELLALGVANLASGLSAGFPLSASASRSVVPASIGTHSQLVSLIAAGFVTASLLVLGPLLATFPQAALGGVILAAAFAIIDIAGFRTLWRLSRTEFALAVVTASCVMLVDVLTGVLVALGLSAIIALWRIARPHDAVLGGVEDLDGWVPLEEFPAATRLDGLLVYRFDAPLFFANAAWFRQRVLEALKQNPGEEAWLVCDFEGVGSVDTTALQVLEELCTDLAQSGLRQICVARANVATRQGLERAGLVQPSGPLRAFPTINAAVRAFEALPAPKPEAPSVAIQPDPAA